MYIVKVITNAKKTELVGKQDNFLKIKLNAVPENGRANKELIKFLADYFNTAKSNIEIVRGLKNKNKLIRIEGLTK